MSYESYRRLTAAALIAALGTACGDDFDPGSRVTSLRVLAVHADLPFAAPGETVSLDALAFDPKQGSRPRDLGVGNVRQPGSVHRRRMFRQNGPRHREDGSAAGDHDGCRSSKFAFTVPSDIVSSLPPDAAANAYVGVVTVACPGELMPVTSPSASEPLPFQCNDADTGRHLGLDEYEVGIKRVFVRARDRNANPTIANVTWDGVDSPETEVKEVAACTTTGNMFSDCDGADKHTVAANITANWCPSQA